LNLKEVNYITMLKEIKLVLILLLLLVNGISYAQKNTPIENGSIFWLKDGSKLIGRVIEEKESVKQLEIITGDTVSIQSNLTKKFYLTDEISLYENAKFHYKKGILLTTSLGFSNNHFNADFSINNRFRNKFEIGMGIGHHYNDLWLNIPDGFVFLNINSLVTFVQGKFFLNNGSKRLYVKGKLGSAFNYSNWGISSMENGIMLDGALGVTFASRKRRKQYFEISQYTCNARGIVDDVRSNFVADVHFNTWFNRVVFTYGIEFGR